MKTLHTLHFTTRSNTHLFIRFKADHYSPDTNMQIELEEYTNPHTGKLSDKPFMESQSKAPLADLNRIVKKFKKIRWYTLRNEY